LGTIGSGASPTTSLRPDHAAEVAVDEVAHAPNRGGIGESDAHYRDEKGSNLMSTSFIARLFVALAVAAPTMLAGLPKDAAAQGQNPPPRRDVEQRAQINAWTVGLAGGLIEGAPLRLAAEMARVADDGPNMHVLPIVTRGPTENLNDLLYLKGVDLAIINSDAMDEYKIRSPEIVKRVTYLLSLFPSELHIFVRPEIQSLQDLAGKKVNFNTLGTAAAFSGPLIFSRLGVNIEKTFIPHPVALQQMRKGEMAAVVFITSKPVDAFVRGQWEPGFKFLPLPYEAKYEDYYLPATLEASDYPSLIKAGERISTIAVPTVLVAYNWPTDSNRYQRVARFTDLLFSRIETLQGPAFAAQWKSINLGATVPGLTRFPAAQAWLDRKGSEARAKR
jgi:TRAP-type uncharacterized transport system substrate-binding protein